MIRILLNGKLWIVGKVVDLEAARLAPAGAWEFQGVYDDQAVAESACVTDGYFVGPAVLNRRLPDQQTSWAGAYYPRLEPRPTEVAA
jgi:hypothetical protein